MKVVSFVPSWTETLIECDIDVVGRTRFCIHPKEKIKNIAAVGGTKDCHWEKVKDLNPDLVIFDEEENLKEMSESCPYPWLSTHVTGIQSMPSELLKLSEKLKNDKLVRLSERWESVCGKQPSRVEIPGVLQWLRTPSEPVKEFVYVIWKNPWMAVGENTFIGSIFKHLGFQNYFTVEKYPKFEIEKIPQHVTLLFSSEPYPFFKKPPVIDQFPNPMAIVDGEKYGWFGIRSLQFLESL